jgi:hypothetical protein
LLSRAAVENYYVIMANLDLSAAFDLVNFKLLTKRLRIMGVPMDFVNLIRIWLKFGGWWIRFNFSAFRHRECPGFSACAHFLCYFCLAPFYLIQITNFADDSFVIRCNKQLLVLFKNLECDLQMIVKWLKESGIKVK